MPATSPEALENKKRYDREYYKTYPNKDRSKYLKIHRNSSLMKRYGITIEDYDRFSENQNHVCAICGNTETATIKGVVKNLAVDHCHQSGKVRGLLCADCNRALGMFKDNIQNLESAINYLKGE